MGLAQVSRKNIHLKLVQKFKDKIYPFSRKSNQN